MSIFDDFSASPMLIGAESEAFDSPDFLYELKLDGERGLAYLGERTELRNKRKIRMTAKFPELDTLHRAVSHRCILDGEFIFEGEGGKPDFDEVKRRSLMSDKYKIERAARRTPLSFVAYDILYYKDSQTLDMPLYERKALLETTVTENGRISISRVVENDGVRLFELTRQQGLEGIVAKRRDSLYVCGKRTKDWIKCKNLLDDDFVVCGYIESAFHVASVILGQYRGDKLAYKGHVTLGMATDDFAEIRKCGVAKSPPFDAPPRDKNAVWLMPRLVCVVKFMDRTSGGALRQAVFKGLRRDKKPRECVEKQPDFSAGSTSSVY